MQINYNFSEGTFRNPFFKEDITLEITANSVNCTKQNRELCKTKCDQIMREMSNDYDLTKKPKNTGINETLGQYICDSIGKDVNYKYIIAAAEYYCYEDLDHLDYNYMKSWEKTNPMFEAICCEEGKFQVECEWDPSKDEFWMDLFNTTTTSATTKF